MMGFIRRFLAPTVHDMRDHGVLERLSPIGGHAAYVGRPVYRGDIIKMWDGDWLVEQVEPQAPVYLCRISRLSARVAA